MNRVQLIGNIGKKPEFDYKKEIAVLKFSVAVNSKVKEQKVTEWFKVVVFEKLAETLKVYLESGMPVFIEGSLKINKYKNDKGEERQNVYILAHKVNFFANKNTEGTETEGDNEE